METLTSPKPVNKNPDKNPVGETLAVVLSLPFMVNPLDFLGLLNFHLRKPVETAVKSHPADLNNIARAVDDLSHDEAVQAAKQVNRMHIDGNGNKAHQQVIGKIQTECHGVVFNRKKNPK